MQRYQQVSSTLPESIQRLRNRPGDEQGVEITSGSRMALERTSPATMMKRRLHSLFMNVFPCLQSTKQQSTTLTPTRQTPLARRRREALIQCSLYVLAFFVSYIFLAIYHIMLRAGHFNYSVCLLSQFFTPAQGVFNFLVFLRPRVKSFLVSEPDLTRAKALWKAVICRDMVSLTQARRRRSLQDTQQNGGRRYTAREFHMRELNENAQAS